MRLENEVAGRYEPVWVGTGRPCQAAHAGPQHVRTGTNCARLPQPAGDGDGADAPLPHLLALWGADEPDSGGGADADERRSGRAEQSLAGGAERGEPLPSD